MGGLQAVIHCSFVLASFDAAVDSRVVVLVHSRAESDAQHAGYERCLHAQHYLAGAGDNYARSMIIF